MRTFIAIELDEAIRERLAGVQERLRGMATGVKWVRPQNVHLTLKFLGEIEEDAGESIAAALAEAASGVEPFEMRVTGVGSFPPKGAPRVVWAGIEEPTGRLLELHRRIEQALEPLGFEREKRRFTAHATIGRVKKPRGGHKLRQALEPRGGDDFGVQAVEDMVLLRSQLSPTGPTYTLLRRLQLGGPPSFPPPSGEG